MHIKIIQIAINKVIWSNPTNLSLIHTKNNSQLIINIHNYLANFVYIFFSTHFVLVNLYIFLILVTNQYIFDSHKL